MARRIDRWRHLLKEVLYRPLPHGLMNWRYFLPRPASLVDYHRRIWLASLPGIPRFPWLMWQCGLWLRWQLYGGWRSCWKTLRRDGTLIAVEEDFSLFQQFVRIAPMVFGWCIPAAELYRFGCIRKPQAFLQFVYSHETTAFHRWHSHRPSRQSLMLLQDKLRQTQMLNLHGVPMASILAIVPLKSRGRLTDWLSHDQPLFCKARHGSGGRGAFAAWLDHGVIRGWSFSGSYLTATQVATAWQRLLVEDDLLLQPRLRTHPALCIREAGEDVATVRFISIRQQDELTCFCATLELSISREFSGGSCRRHVILPISTKTGRISAFPEKKLSTETLSIQKQIEGQLLGSQVPDWKKIAAGSFQAHRQFPDIRGIAWDWAITAEGPYLLEGNAGWSLVAPQLLHGGMLADGVEQQP